MRKSPVLPGRFRFDAVAPFVAGLSNAELAELAEVGEATVKGWRRPDRPDVTIPDEVADRLAARLAIPPTTIWPDFYADLERRCDWQPCSAVFVPRRRDQRFCSAPCRTRWRDNRPEVREAKLAARRDRYANDPEYAARRKAAAAEYARDQRNRRAINAMARRSYHRRRARARAQIAA